MKIKRSVITPALLVSVMLLTACGGGGNSSIPVIHLTGSWAATGNLTSARKDHTATLLPNGKVLVVAGDNLVSAELYDPSTGNWTATGSLATERFNHTATLLSNGKVLVAGGSNAINSYIPDAELYDPSTGSWTTTGSLATGRNVNTATLLPNGKVLVAGGFGETTPPSQITALLASAELYDPSTGSWAETGSLTIARGYHTATLLPNGKVLVVGGSDLAYTALASTELYW